MRYPLIRCLYSCLFSYVLFLLVFGPAVGCSGSTGSPEGTPCSGPELKQACTCTDGKTGSQSCSQAKTWQACDCSGSGTNNNNNNNNNGETCKPDHTKACSCKDNGVGIQKCSAEKKWSDCDCSNSGACKEGQTQVCNCTNGDSGSKTCEKDGKWGTCTCGGKNECKDGQSQKCACQDPNSEGSQGCFNGKWGVCKCKTIEKCKPEGATRACQCTNGAFSSITCQKDGKWSKCECGGPVCKLGEKQKAPCLCPNGMKSERICKKDEKGNPHWAPCECSCKKGETRACECPFQQTGSRGCFCQGNNCTWGVCKCPTCKGDGDCKSLKSAKKCDVNNARCVECLKKADCTDASRSVCHTDGTCVQCSKDSDCSGGTSCDPVSFTCKKFEKSSIKGVITRCQDGVPRPKGCAGNPATGDGKGNIYMLFFTGKDFPPKYTEKPFVVHKIPNVDFKDASKKVPYQVSGIPTGSWLVYVFIDDNNNWSMKEHMPDTGDLVGFISAVKVEKGKTNSHDFFLWDRY